MPYPRVATIPGLAWYAGWYNRGIDRLTRHLIAVRQEEHRLFLGTVEPEARLLVRMLTSGRLPPDTYIAIPCVGAIPYFSDLRTPDQLGLTDRAVARQPMAPPQFRMMSHAKQASDADMIARGVNVISVGPHLLTNDSRRLGVMLADAQVRGPTYVSAPLFNGYRFVGILPGTPETVRARFAKLGLAQIPGDRIRTQH